MPQSDKNVTMKRKLGTTPKLALYLSSSVSLALSFVVIKKDFPIMVRVYVDTLWTSYE